MNLKTFTASDMTAALAMVKRELGPAAVILHTRTYRRGGIFGLGAKQVVEITACDQPSLAKARRKPSSKDAPGRATAGASSPAASEPAGDLIRRTYAAARAELTSQRPVPAIQPVSTPAPQRMTPPITKLPGGIPGAGIPGAGIPGGAKVPCPKSNVLEDVPGLIAPALAPVGVSSDQLAQEMQAVRRMVAQMMRQQRERSRTEHTGAAAWHGGDLPDKLFDQYLCLLKQEVTEELAEEVIGQVRSSLTPAQMEDAGLVHKAVLESVAKLIPTDESAGKLTPTPDRRPRTIALVGPTGVGKTTTIAKLAASFKLKHKKKVGLITQDTYRIAAVDQLRTYANIIGVPLHVVTNVDEMVQATRQCAVAGCDVVLIDTAGRSQRDDPRLEQLSSFLRAADPHEVHLVLSSTCTQSVLLDTVERFSRVRTDRILFTKLDEAVSFGVLLNVARKVNKRLSFITTGQEVPHHIEPSRPDRLAALVLGDGREG